MSSYGFIDNSLIEYPGEIASIIFYSECQAKCPYCYNKGRIGGLFLHDVVEKLKNVRPYVTGVVLTGGEITESPEFPVILYYAKALNLKVKVHTNGSNPMVISSLKKYIDRIDMDLKTSPDMYCHHTGILWENVDLTIRASKGVPLHFHTTLCPNIMNINVLNKLFKFVDKNCFETWTFQECEKHGHNEKVDKTPFIKAVKDFKEN